MTTWRWCVIVSLLPLAACRTAPYSFFSVDDGGITDLAAADLTSTDFSAAICGDGIVQSAEACDDGNRADDDGCRADCTRARCGDGIVWIGVEACDDGNLVDTDACRNTCGLPTCGDGLLAGTEACDDGNHDDTDGCLSSCLLAHCGDGALRVELEQCDDGNTLDTDGCRADCMLAFCGDGVVYKGNEGCDDGNNIPDDNCDNDCHLPVCGDGVRAGAEECDHGNANGDQPAFLISQPSGTRIATDAIVQSSSSSDFYNYFSASSHTGLEQVGESRIYLYVDALTGRLSLVLTHGVDFDTTGLIQPASRVEMDIIGLPVGFAIDLSDDSPSEFSATSSSTAEGRWDFNRNSDGGVLGGLPFPGAWIVTVVARFQQGLTTWGWVRNDLQRIPLVMSEPITVQAFDQSTMCRTTCTIPRCGDGLLDGGEVCDDGNTITGDGCAANCKSLQ